MSESVEAKKGQLFRKLTHKALLYCEFKGSIDKDMIITPSSKISLKGGLSSALCKICGASVPDVLVHYRIDHDVTDADSFNEKMQRSRTEEERRREFSDLVERLKDQVQKGLISAEEYRKRIEQWTKTYE